MKPINSAFEEVRTGILGRNFDKNLYAEFIEYYNHGYFPAKDRFYAIKVRNVDHPLFSFKEV